jgi:Flp pilus assembly protein TadD
MLTARALEADPSHVRTLAESSIMTATAMADPPSANLTASVLDRIGQARRLDPLNPWAMAIEAFDLALLGRLPEALEAAARAVAADGGNFTAQWARVVALTWVNRDAEARHAIDEALAMSGRHPNILTELAALNAAGGDRDAAQAVFNELKTRGQTGYVCFAAQAAAAASAGHLDEARSLLRKAIDARDSYLHFCKFPAWRPAWQDARCAALLAEMEYVK